MPYFWEVPGYAIEFPLSPLDPALQLAVGESVLLVEIKCAFIPKEAIPGFWLDILYVVGGDEGGG